MALTRSITSLITDDTGHATQDFLSCTPERWADIQMANRYGQMCLSTDGDNHFARLCWQYLCEEYKSLRAWFTVEGRLSSVLQSKFLMSRLSGPVGDGIDWDFKPNGDPEPRMLQFKGTLIAAQRAAELIPAEGRNSGNMQFGGLVKIIRSAYSARAEIHSWRPVSGEGDVKYSGTDMSRRWVSHRTNILLTRLGAPPGWSWEASRCRALFGPIDEERMTLP